MVCWDKRQKRRSAPFVCTRWMIECIYFSFGGGDIYWILVIWKRTTIPRVLCFSAPSSLDWTQNGGSNWNCWPGSCNKLWLFTAALQPGTGSKALGSCCPITTRNNQSKYTRLGSQCESSQLNFFFSFLFIEIYFVLILKLDFLLLD